MRLSIFLIIGSSFVELFTLGCSNSVPQLAKLSPGANQILSTTLPSTGTPTPTPTATPSSTPIVTETPTPTPVLNSVSLSACSNSAMESSTYSCTPVVDGAHITPTYALLDNTCTWLSLDSNNPSKIVGAPDGYVSASCSFVYQVNAGTLSVSSPNKVITVDPVNHPPTIAGVSSQAIWNDETRTIAVAVGPGGGSLEASQTLGASCDTSSNFSISNCSIVNDILSVTYQYSGTLSAPTGINITLTVSDNGTPPLTTSQSFQSTVSPRVRLNIATNQTNFNLASYLGQLTALGTMDVSCTNNSVTLCPVEVTIPAGVTISAGSSNSPAFDTGVFLTSALTLIVNGSILGTGGKGGAGASSVANNFSSATETQATNGTDGGPALKLQLTTILQNSGTIAGGGGGGGGGGGFIVPTSFTGGGGGGGGAGNLVGGKGLGGPGSTGLNGFDGIDSTIVAGGFGGTALGSGYGGGKGGDLGTNGNDGEGVSSQASISHFGSGGAAGAAILGKKNIQSQTNNPGSAILGPVIN